MSINPVTALGYANEAPAVVPQVRPAPAPVSDPKSASIRPESAPSPKPETHEQPQTSDTSEIPQDEVQVQRDSESNGEIVIRYVDHSGQIILQIPSSQVLGLARAIERALEEQGKHTSSAVNTPELGRRR